MPPDREQRRLERQRGAAKRDVRNVSGFDLIIPNQDVAPLEPRQSGRSRKTPQPDPLVPQQSSKRTPVAGTLPRPRSAKLTPVSYAAPTLPRSPNTSAASSLPRPRYSNRPSASVAIGKRKRPSGEAIFDIPGSPLPEAAAEEPVGGSADNASPDGNEIGDVGELDVEPIAGPSNVLDWAEVNGNAIQKHGVKKRKKRKSIGQQATKRAKAKVLPIQRRADSNVKPESISPEPPPEGSSRLDVFPETLEDPAEAQIQNELAGAAARGRRYSLAEDGADEAPGVATEQRKPKLTRDNGKSTKVPRKTNPPHRRHLPVDPYVHPAPTSVPTIESEDDLEEQNERHEEEPEETQSEIDDDDESEAEDEIDETDEDYRVKKPSTTPKKSPLSKPLKPKRKKRKSIGQQRPKRPSTSRPVKNSSIPTTTTTTTAKPRPKPPPNPQTAITTSNTTARPARSNTVPITIYRPAPASSPDTDPDPDPLTAPLPTPYTTALTAPDILSQLSRELVEKTAANASLSARAQRTIAVYGQELEARMKQLGQALATNAGLGRRLREVRKEERRVKGELEGAEVEVGGVRERIVEGKEVERGMRLTGLMEGLGEVVRRGWGWERGREGG